MWQSVDYTLLSAPTRPGSPANGENVGGLEFLASPSRLFDFADFTAFGVFPEGVDVFGTLPLLEDKASFDDAERGGLTNGTQGVPNN